jgi:TonB family protein
MVSTGIIFYLAKAGMCLAIFYGFFYLLFRRETFFQLNRFYLLASVLISMLIPLIPVPETVPGGNSPYVVLLETVNAGTQSVVQSIGAHPGWISWLSYIYFTGVVFMFMRSVFTFTRIGSLIRKSGIHREGQIDFVYLNGQSSPFSFFHLVFINRNDLHQDTREKILAHEREHIRQWHSLDLLIIELVCAVQWFNPVIWMLRHSIREIHEYLADHGVIREGINPVQYQIALLSATTGKNTYLLSNNFNQSLLKRRFIMMTKRKSNPQSRWKFLGVIPLVPMMVLFFSNSSGHYLPSSDLLLSDQVSELLAATKTGIPEAEGNPNGITSVRPVHQDDTLYTVVEEQPSFPGGHDGMVEFMVKNITYPPEAKSKGIQGVVYVSFTISNTGKVGNVKILRGIGGGCDEEAIRIVKAMPDWTPGKEKGKPVNVAFNLPIRFSLSNDTKKDTDMDVDVDKDKDK